MNLAIGIIVASVAVVVFFAIKAAVIKQPFLNLLRGFAAVAVLIVIAEMFGGAEQSQKNSIAFQLVLSAVGLAGFAIAFSVPGRRRNQLPAWPQLTFVMLSQVLIGLVVFGGAVFSAKEPLKAVLGGLIYAGVSGGVPAGLLGALEYLYPVKFNKFFQRSLVLSLGVFASALINLFALILYYPVFPPVFAIGMALVVMLILYARNFLSAETFFDRNKVINSMHIGWMILDKENQIVDVNPFIEVITGQSADKLKGGTVDDWMSNGNIFMQGQVSSQNSFRASVNFSGVTYAFDVRSLALQGDDDDFSGRLLLWQDVTEQIRLDEARYRVLATKINLMRSISSAANHITDIEIFLEAAIFQIVSSFGCLAGFVFMRDSDFIGDDKASFRLDAAYSYADLRGPEQIVQHFRDYLVDLAPDSRAVQIRDFRAGLFLENDHAVLQGKLLICPIMIDEHLQGAICLYRESAYDEDEAIGLEMIANELSMLVYVDHQRREAVSFSERKKLVKDLHDTVTQQLYGLLYQVEIAQAQSEIGGVEHLPASLDKIGDTARQALREMRLFLHELRPVDLQNEGLVSALHHRLTAVEGRANIQPRFISPETLEISLQQELNLYHIAREALNNVLRHSHAKKVVVNLKQNRNNICLEISDDGVGFDKALLKSSGGMGVKNIRGWAAQIHAKLQIRSEPGAGTTIKVLVPRNG